MSDRVNKTNKPDVTEEIFNKAIEQLSKEGKSITIRAVREITGGANETISAFIRKYQRQAFFASFKDTMPQSFQEAIIKAAQDLYKDFEEKWAKERCKLQDQYDLKDEELRQLIKEADEKTLAAEKRAEEAEKRVRELEKEIAELKEVNNKLTTSISTQSEAQNQQSKQTSELLIKLNALLEQNKSNSEAKGK